MTRTKRKIVVVDDDELNIAMIREILGEDYEIFVAGNGRIGFDLICTHFADLSAVLLDIVMPEMDGFEVLQQMQKQDRLKEIPVLMMSSHDSVENEAHCLEIGAFDFIRKPYQRMVLKARIKNAIDLRESSDALILAERDQLTGVKNRNAYYKDIELIEQQNKNSKIHMGILFADVNGLKRTNDEKGHDAGDQLIKSIVKILTDQFTNSNVYRLGGDEFVAFYFGDEKRKFTSVVKACKKEMTEDASASIGSIWIDSAESLEQFVSLADKNMYQEKSKYYQKLSKTEAKNLIINKETLPDIQAIADALPGGFLLFRADEDAELIMINETLVKLFGCKSEEDFMNYTQNAYGKLFHPDDAERIRQEVMNQLKDQNHRYHIQYRVVCKNGEEKWLDDYANLVHSKTLGDVFYVFVTDITTEHNYYEQIARNEQIIRALTSDYAAIYLMDFEYDSMEAIVCQNDVSQKYFKDHEKIHPILPLIKKFVKNHIREDEQEECLQFMSPKNIQERIKQERYYSKKFHRYNTDGKEEVIKVVIAAYGEDGQSNKAVFGARVVV